MDTSIEAISGLGDVRVDRPALARQQLVVSAGAAVLMMVAAIGVLGNRTGETQRDQLAASVSRTAPIVQTVVREVPSTTMQAVDQAKVGGRS